MTKIPLLSEAGQSLAWYPYVKSTEVPDNSGTSATALTVKLPSTFSTDLSALEFSDTNGALSCYSSPVLSSLRVADTASAYYTEIKCPVLAGDKTLTFPATYSADSTIMTDAAGILSSVSSPTIAGTVSIGSLTSSSTSNSATIKASVSGVMSSESLYYSATLYSNNQTISTGVEAVAAISNSQYVDNAAMVADKALFKMSIVKSGRYLLWCNSVFKDSASSFVRGAKLLKNGAITLASGAVKSAGAGLGVSVVLTCGAKLTSGDYLTAALFQNSGIDHLMYITTIRAIYLAPD